MSKKRQWNFALQCKRLNSRHGFIWSLLVVSAGSNWQSPFFCGLGPGSHGIELGRAAVGM